MDATKIFDDLAPVIVFALPVAVLLLLLVLLLVRRRRGRSAHRAETRPDGASPAKAEAGAGPSALLDAGSATQPAVSAGLPLETRIEAALSQRALLELAPLYLDLARRQAAEGNHSARMASLRSAAGYGALHGPKATHAEVRLELAEAAYAGGDLTSACEQWQIARTAFQEAGLADAHARVERRMSENGCPTDWVLTDF